jgi:hypothetical protein
LFFHVWALHVRLRLTSSFQTLVMPDYRRSDFDPEPPSLLINMV